MLHKDKKSQLYCLAKEKVARMELLERKELAQKHKKRALWWGWGFGLPLVLCILGCLGVWIYLLIAHPLMSNLIEVIIYILFLLLIQSLTLIYCIKDLVKIRNKTLEEIAIIAMIKKLKGAGLSERLLTNVNLTAPNFHLTNIELLNSSLLGIEKLLIDDEHKQFIHQKGKSYSTIYNFSDLLGYDVYENGNMKVQGRAGSALIGGAFFGLGGLIAGSSMSRQINNQCSQLKLIIRLNNINCSHITITYIDGVPCDKAGWYYCKKREYLQSVCSMLEYILNKKTLLQSFTVPKTETRIQVQSNKEQLQELKEMLDDGLITQDDFENKKKQILGL